MGRSRAAIRVAVIKGEQRYPMFDAAEIAADGAFVEGPLLLETGEQLDVELSFADDTTLRLRARVADVSTGDRPGMRITWSDLGGDDRALLESRLTHRGPNQSAKRTRAEVNPDPRSGNGET